MLKLTNVTKTFGDFTALNSLSMTVPKGSVYGLVGPNGAGKSTAIRLATGVYRPDSGQITVDGLPVFENPEAKRRICSIPDEVFYFPSATLAEMRKFYKGLYPRFDDALFTRLQEVFQLPPRGAIRRFSKGMQKQAAFQLALCTRHHGKDRTHTICFQNICSSYLTPHYLSFLFNFSIIFICCQTSRLFY